MNIKPNRSQATASVTYVPPQVKRPRSYGWIVVIVMVLTSLGWWSWDRFLRVSAWGQVIVDEIAISSPVDGLIDSMRVFEDAMYAGGSAAFSVVDIEARDELHSLELELKLLDSQLSEKVATHHASRDEYLYARDTKLADMQDDLGEARRDLWRIRQDQGRLIARLSTEKTEHERLVSASLFGAAARQELDDAAASVRGTEEELSALANAQIATESRIDALEQSFHRPVPPPADLALLTDPLTKQTELVRERIRQVSERLGRQTASLPTSGVVRRIVRRPGEFVRLGEPVVMLQDPSTIRLLAYVDQRWLGSLATGDTVRVLSAYAAEVHGVVTSLRPRLESAPLALAIRHPKGEPLLPIEISLDAAGRRLLIPGSTVRVYPVRANGLKRSREVGVEPVS